MYNVQCRMKNFVGGSEKAFARPVSTSSSTIIHIMFKRSKLLRKFAMHGSEG